MINQWIIQAVVHYLFTQLAAGVKTVDWQGLVAKGEALVNEYVPAFLQPMVDGVVVAAVGALQAALQDTADLETVANAIANKDYAGALAALETLVGKVVHPGVASVLPAVAALKVAA